jgi:membrane fusion protein (multidrug efflux system)
MSFNSKFYSSLLLVFSIFITSCSDADKNKSAVAFELEIPFFKAQKMDLPIYQEFVGQVYGKKDITIRARVDGFLEGIYFEEGSKVKAGQLLYEIEPESLNASMAAAESKVKEAETFLAKSKNDLDRIEPLAKMNAVSKSELDHAKAQYHSALAQVEAAKADKKQTDISLSYSEIRSPIDGLIGITNAKVGEYVGRDPNPVILNTVSQIDTVLVRFYLTESDYLNLASIYQGQKMEENKNNRADLELILADGSVYPIKGKTDFVDNKVNNTTGSLLAQASFPNPTQLLRPGLFARIKVAIKNEKDAIVVPQRAVKFIQGEANLMISDVNGNVEFRKVVLGAKYKNLWQIIEGVSQDELVLIYGSQKLKTGMKVKPVDSQFKIQD